MKNKLLIMNTRTTYGIIAVILHWFFAIAILGLFASGFYMVELTYYDPWYHPLPAWHVFFGILCFILLPLRILWHFLTPQPSLQTQLSLEKKLAPLAHKFLLLLTTLIIISGYLIISVDTHEILWLQIPLPSFDFNIPQQASLAGQWHKYMAYALMALVVLHVLASLKHHFLDQKPIFKKILWPFSKKQ